MPETVKLTHGTAVSTSCAVNLFGATLTSWIVEDVENIFVSSKAKTDGTKVGKLRRLEWICALGSSTVSKSYHGILFTFQAIRGGIPVCFPQFGPWEFGPQHGFARDSKNWKVEEAVAVDASNGDATVGSINKSHRKKEEKRKFPVPGHLVPDRRRRHQVEVAARIQIPLQNHLEAEVADPRRRRDQHRGFRVGLYPRPSHLFQSARGYQVVFCI